MDTCDFELVRRLARIEIEKAFTANIKVWKFKEDNGVTYSEAILPEKKHKGDSGYDLYTCFDDVTIANAKSQGKKEPDPIILYPGKTMLITTGICQEIPEGFELQVRPQSGCSAVLNMNENNNSLNVELTNVSNDPILIKHHSYLLHVHITKCVNITCCFKEK